MLIFWRLVIVGVGVVSLLFVVLWFLLILGVIVFYLKVLILVVVR